jgi:hypothetical protein
VLEKGPFQGDIKKRGIKIKKIVKQGCAGGVRIVVNTKNPVIIIMTIRYTDDICIVDNINDYNNNNNNDNNNDLI